MPRVRPSGKKQDIQTLATNIQRNMNAMFKATYYNEPTGDRQIDDLARRINSNLDNIVKYNMNTSGVSSVAKLYSRIKDKSRPGGPGSSMEDLFNAASGYDDFYANFMQNRYLRELDDEIDAVCKYFPDLLEALEIKKEGVLSADHFSKDFMTIMAPDGIDEAIHAERCKQLKREYNLLQFVDDIYDRTAKYGEQFVYHVPYSTALSRLLTNKPNTSYNDAVPMIHEDAVLEFGMQVIPEASQEAISAHDTFNMIFTESGFSIVNKNSGATVINEAVNVTTVDKSGVSKSKPLLKPTEKINFKLEFCRSGIIESFVRDTQVAHRAKTTMTESCSTQFLENAPLKHMFTESSVQAIHEKLEGKHKKKFVMVRKSKDDPGKLVIDKDGKGELGYDERDSMKSKGLVPRDGLIGGIAQIKPEEVKVKVPGSVIANPRREHVIPIYMNTNETCLGYYYLEFSNTGNMDDAFQGFTNVMSDTLTTLRGSQSGVNAPFNNVEQSRQDEILRYIAGELSRFIDKEFVQANQDLRNEIYTILKYNDLFNSHDIDKMRVTFVPPEDMYHVYFKLDKITHRGISDLDKAMVPAKIYACMYITDAIGQMIRGQDKRVYYVKQQVDTNIAQVLMNTIQQIKQGNFGLRQFQSINNVLNITGRFNDFFVPTTVGGDSPLSIDVIPGQQFSDNSEMKQQLREMAVTNVDVPFELIQTRQSVDYAMQLSMSNSKFLRKIFKRQSQYQDGFLSRFISRLYSFEYNENVELKVQLPPPMFLTMANTNQLVDNTKAYIQSITEIELQDVEDEGLKTEYQDMLFKYYIGTQIDLSKHEMILQKAMAKVASERKPAEEE